MTSSCIAWYKNGKAIFTTQFVRWWHFFDLHFQKRHETAMFIQPANHSSSPYLHPEYEYKNYNVNRKELIKQKRVWYACIYTYIHVYDRYNFARSLDSQVYVVPGFHCTSLPSYTSLNEGRLDNFRRLLIMFWGFHLNLYHWSVDGRKRSSWVTSVWYGCPWKLKLRKRCTNVDDYKFVRNHFMLISITFNLA